MIIQTSASEIIQTCFSGICKQGLMKKARSFTICIQKTFILRLPFLIIRVVYWLGYREMDQIGEIF